jgi:alpha-glucosidase
LSEQTGETPWWHGAVLYQVYVRSWRDTDGDGYGDLRGVIEGLDHLSWLGVDGVWLSPTMPSPDDDWGYDVSDYRGVHPELGSLDDLDELVEAAGRRAMRVLLDLVPNHTSSRHEWFIEARGSRDALHRDFYVWADPAPGGGPPNNWLDHTGEAAWTFDEATGQYYLHNFLPSQPDLNWWNPEVHAALREVLDFWLDRGVAGFRIDVAHGLYKDARLRDDPPAVEGDRRGRYGLLPVYSSHRPDVHGVDRDWRALVGRRAPPALLLGETWVLELAELATFYGRGDELQLAFNFPFVFAEFTATALRSVVGETFARLADTACPIWMASNHDISRFATRWCQGDDARTRLAMTVLTTLPGTVVLYYGDEIGMTDVDVPAELQRDAMSRQGRSDRFSRDRARTPMQWEPDANGGFAPAGVQPWLPVGDSAARSVAAQRRDPHSLLALTQHLLRLRRLELGGAIAAYSELPAGRDQWVYRSGRLVVAANLSDHQAQVAGVARCVVLSSDPERDVTEGAGDVLDLGAWEAVVTCDVDPLLHASGSGAGTLPSGTEGSISPRTPVGKEN